METRICKICGKEKNFDEFYPNRIGKPQARCKLCLSEQYINDRRKNSRQKRMNHTKDLKQEIKNITNPYIIGDKLIELYKLKYSVDELTFIFESTPQQVEEYLTQVGIFGVEFHKCSICKIIKPFAEFHNDKNRYSGKDCRCKACKKEHDQKLETRVRKKEFTKIWTQKNREHRNKYANNRYHTNIKAKLSICISSVMYYSLKGKRQKNGQHWETLVNFTLEQLMEHLESKFDDKMNWGNYGTYWHVDHIVGIANFNYTSYEDEAFKKCWSLENLQPLYGPDNQAKSDTISEEWGNVELAAQLL